MNNMPVLPISSIIDIFIQVSLWLVEDSLIFALDNISWNIPGA